MGDFFPSIRAPFSLFPQHFCPQKSRVLRPAAPQNLRRKLRPPRPGFPGGKRENLRSPRPRRLPDGSRTVDGPPMRWSRGLPYRFRRTRAKSARWRAPRAGPGRGLARVGGKSAVRSARRRRMHAPTTPTPDRRFRRFRIFPPRRAANPPARAPCHTHPTLTCRKNSPLGARECDTLHVTLTSHSRAEKNRRLGRLGVAFGKGGGPRRARPRSAQERSGRAAEAAQARFAAVWRRQRPPLKIQEWFDPRAAHRGEPPALKNKVRRAAENFAIRAHFSRKFL